MENESYLRYLLTDRLSFRQYFKNKHSVCLTDVRRSILLAVRSRCYSVPDHYYRLGEEFSFDGINRLSDLFTVGLPNLAADFLMIREHKVYVRGERMNEWQLLLPLMPPLLLTVAMIWKEHRPVVASDTDFTNDFLLPSLKYTALPPAYLPEMEVLKNEYGGFMDLHIHLNGSIETDLVWQDLLKSPKAVFREIKAALKNDKVKEQIEQLTDIVEPIDFLYLFQTAQRLREWLFGTVERGVYITVSDSFSHLLNEISAIECCGIEHPYTATLGNSASPLLLEGLFYAKVLDYLSLHPDNDAVAGAFHFYLLILGVCNRMLVQAPDAFGFEQFQKYTSNKWREFSEKNYSQRFLQLAGNNLNNVCHIEGRFSPQNSLQGNLKILNKIVTGFDFLVRTQKLHSLNPTSLSLIAHFIKKADDGKRETRFGNLSDELKRKTDALIALKNTRGQLASYVTGIDAAASEFDTPPWVFAEAYRKLREAGFCHFTFHAGEDFFHLLTGLRSIFEAMEFLGLQASDRIGHATATGIDVQLWKHNVGEKIWMRVEDYMDDLTFAYDVISTYKEKHLEALLPIIALRIEKYAAAVYNGSYSVSNIIEAWKNRRYPLEDACAESRFCAKTAELTHMYHCRAVRKRGAKVISIDTYDIFQEGDLVCLQKLLLRIMHQKQIVIETLPTSNVMIGHHHSYATYHLFNWYKWGKEGANIPAIVVGTDDAGIFATNLYNEYCHIYCMLVFEKHLSPHEAMDFIERVAHNAKVYNFHTNHK